LPFPKSFGSFAGALQNAVCHCSCLAGDHLDSLIAFEALRALPGAEREAAAHALLPDGAPPWLLEQSRRLVQRTLSLLYFVNGSALIREARAAAGACTPAAAGCQAATTPALLRGDGFAQALLRRLRFIASLRREDAQRRPCIAHFLLTRVPRDFVLTEEVALSLTRLMGLPAPPRPPPSAYPSSQNGGSVRGDGADVQKSRKPLEHGGPDELASLLAHCIQTLIERDEALSVPQPSSSPRSSEISGDTSSQEAPLLRVGSVRACYHLRDDGRIDAEEIATTVCESHVSTTLEFTSMSSHNRLSHYLPHPPTLPPSPLPVLSRLAGARTASEHRRACRLVRSYGRPPPYRRRPCCRQTIPHHRQIAQRRPGWTSNSLLCGPL